MAQPGADAVRRGYDAFNRRDIDAILAGLSDDIEYRMPLDPMGVHPVFRGHEGVRRFYQAIFDAFELFEVELEAVRPMNDGVIVASGRMHARPRGGTETTTFGFTHFWRLEGNRAVAVAFHDARNPFALLEDADESGLESSPPRD